MKILFIILTLNLLFINPNFAQSDFKLIKKQMIEYQLSDSFRELIIKDVIENIDIISDIYVINVNENNNRCLISIECCFELDDMISKYTGFFEIEKRFFYVINGHNDFLYPTDNIKEIKYKKYLKNEQVKNGILYLETYTDDTPSWYFEYKEGKFFTINYYEYYNNLQR